MENSKRISFYDALNVLSCFGVVCLHSNGYIHSFNKDGIWGFRVFVEVLFYFAVPVFFMLSGATLMTYRNRYSTIQFVQKRLLKAVLPYCFWGGAVFILLHLPQNGFSGDEIKTLITWFTTGKIPYTNYWFFIPLFMIYIFIPFLSIMVVRLTKRQIQGLLGLLVLFQSVLPAIYALMGLEFKVSLPIGGYFIYALLGYYIVTHDIEKNRVLCYVIYLLAICTLLARYLMIYYSSTREPMLFTYFGLYAIFPSIAVFLIFKQIGFSDARVSNLLAFLAKRSYGIFLIHTFLIHVLSRVIDERSLWFIPTSAIVVYFVSLIIVTVLQSFKPTKYLVP